MNDYYEETTSLIKHYIQNEFGTWSEKVTSEAFMRFGGHSFSSVIFAFQTSFGR